MIYKLDPILTYNLWGGEKLSKLYHQKEGRYGEAWILSCLKDKNSPLGRGYFYRKKHRTLKDLFDENPNIVRQGYKGEFPLLIKLIDAKQDLSIQVHPEAKTEFWHILNKRPSSLYMGFRKKMDKKLVSNILKKGDITESLNHIEVSEGDSYLIKPGTIHAIGAGTFLIEIQRSADITYRLYDFHRKDVNGKERELHISKALETINYSKYQIKNGKKIGQLVKCPFFKVSKEDFDYEKETFNCDKKSFHSVVILSGEGKIIQGLHKMAVKAGDSIFIPAGTGKYKILGTLSFVIVTL